MGVEVGLETFLFSSRPGFSFLAFISWLNWSCGHSSPTFHSISNLLDDQGEFHAEVCGLDSHQGGQLQLHSSMHPCMDAWPLRNEYTFLGPKRICALRFVKQ